jgi:membrane associated rhomboid family serine protease
MRPPESWQRAPATVAIAFVTAAAWLLVAMLGALQSVAFWGGFVPARVGHAAGSWPELLSLLLTPLSATLIHTGVLHLLFNLVVLLYCGRAVEGVLGTRLLVVVYVIGAYAAAGAEYAAGPSSLVTMIGASGAISAVIGAYAMLFGRNRVRIPSPAVATMVNALWVAAGWVILQLLIGYALGTMGTPIAIAAHIGGFLAGLVLAKPLFLWRWRRA